MGFNSGFKGLNRSLPALFKI